MPDLDRAKIVFEKAVAADMADREALVRLECEADELLASYVLDLLAHHDRVNPAEAAACSTAELKLNNERIGPYRLISLIGEGAYGSVHLAEQRAPVRRRVALKLIKPGMDSKEILARFEAERQALALMDHPNVAKVYDAGTTERGAPYFVMEYVPGVTVTQFCDEQKLTVQERIKLFLQICAAVQHAHQKGVIHRDIKPSNILVMLVDGAPVSKVIDFGIAKATSQNLTERTLFTEAGRLVGTPEYMSPEQAGTSGLDVDTRTDIYSLGVVLYELLSGSLPFESETLRKAGFDGIVRLIKEVDPPRLTTRLSRGRRHDVAAQTERTVQPEECGRKPRATITPEQVAARRKTDIRGLLRQLRGDLDWIVYKAMEKERGRRYEGASALAQDLVRYLNNEPILARPPSSLYRLSRLVRRHRAVVATTALVVTLVVVGAAMFVIKSHQVAHQRDKAVAAQIATDRIQHFLLNMIAPDRNATRGPKFTLREMLDQASVEIGDLRTDDGQPLPKIESSVRYMLGMAYSRLGEYAIALDHLRAAVNLQRSQMPASLALADSLSEIGLLYVRSQGNGSIAESEGRRAIEEALQIRSHLLGPNDPLTLRTKLDAAWVEAVATGKGHLGSIYDTTQLAIMTLLCNCPLHDVDELQRQLVADVELVDRLWNEGRREEALAKIKNELDRLCPKHNEPTTRLRQAVSYLAPAFDVESGTPYVGAAEALFESSRRVAAEIHGAQSREWVLCNDRYAAFLIRQSRVHEARLMLEAASATVHQSLGPNDAEWPSFQGLLALSLALEGDIRKAQETLPANDADGAWLNECSWAIVRSPDNSPEAYAIALGLAQRLAVLRPTDSDAINTLGVAQYRVEKYAEALKTLNKSDYIRRKTGKADCVADFAFIAMCYFQLNDIDKAKETLSRLPAILQKEKASLMSESAGFIAEARRLIDTPVDSRQ